METTEEVQLRINKTSRGTYWYAPMVGQTVAAIKHVKDGRVWYQLVDYIHEPSSIFDNNDVEEVAVS